MRTFEWNALRAGEHVMVHDDEDPALRLREGVVCTVQPGRGAANDVMIKVDGTVRRVRRHAVHLIPLDVVGCWRCEAAAAEEVRPAA